MGRHTTLPERTRPRPRQVQRNGSHGRDIPEAPCSAVPSTAPRVDLALFPSTCRRALFLRRTHPGFLQTFGVFFGTLERLDFCTFWLSVDLPRHVKLASRIQKNATLYAIPSKPRRRGRGRPRKKGKKLPNLAGIADSRRLCWESAEVQQYGEIRERKLKAFTCLWYKVCKDRPVLVVIVRDPEKKEEDQYFFTTDIELAPVAVAEICATR